MDGVIAGLCCQAVLAARVALGLINDSGLSARW